MLAAWGLGNRHIDELHGEKWAKGALPSRPEMLTQPGERIIRRHGPTRKTGITKVFTMLDI